MQSVNESISCCLVNVTGYLLGYLSWSDRTARVSTLGIGDSLYRTEAVLEGWFPVVKVTSGYVALSVLSIGPISVEGQVYTAASL